MFSFKPHQRLHYAILLGLGALFVFSLGRVADGFEFDPSQVSVDNDAQQHISTAGPIPIDFPWEKLKPDVKLRWVPCYGLVMQCTRLKVPLDYSNPDGESAAIALIRIPSPLMGTSAYQGPILFNPGGPGGSGVDFVQRNGPLLSVVVGPRFDIVGFDPRGVSHTTPHVYFYKSDAERAQWNIKDSVILNYTSNSLPQFWALSQILGRLAEQRDTGALKHVTTDVVARDMLRIVEAHGRKKINYWGFSYGSVLGATFATMFPDNVGRLIIDGVVDGADYFETRWTENLRDTDKVLESFFSGCAFAGPRRCAFWAPTPMAISRKLDLLLQKLKEQPVPVQKKDLYGVVDYSMVQTLVFGSLYQPYGMFSALAKALSDLEKGKGDTMFELATLIALPGARRFYCACESPFEIPINSALEIQMAVICTDGAVVPSSLEEARRYYDGLAKHSRWAEIWAKIRLSCSGWRSRAKDHFSGPLGANTSFPMLLIGNMADPVTSLFSAHRTARRFPSSVVLTQDSPGHCSLSGASICTAKHIRRYLVEGVLPPVGTVCPVFGMLFPPNPKFPGEAVSQQYLDLEEEDRELLDAVTVLSESMKSPINRPFGLF